jgi:hypothetical protein
VSIAAAGRPDLQRIVGVEVVERDDIDGAGLGAVSTMGLRARRALVAEVAYVAGGAALFASAFVRWVARGAGSGLRGHALIDAVVALGGAVPGLSIARLTVVWYLVPAFGAVSWIACGLTGPRSRASRAVAAVTLVTIVLIVGVFVHLVGFARLGWGPKLAFGGAVVLAASAWLRVAPAPAR